MKKNSRSARIARFHHDGELQAYSQLILSKTASHHLVTVLRTRQGDIIELFNGNGHNYRASLVDTGQRTPGKRAVLELHEALPADSESPARITLIQGISRGDRMDTSIRQSVELGVAHVQPVYTRHSAKALDEPRTLKKLDHWRAILISACEQSGRACLPTLHAPMDLGQWLQLQTDTSIQDAPAVFYVLAPNAKRTLASDLHAFDGAAAQGPTHETQRHIGLIIGPESGLDVDEIEAAIVAGARPVTVGPRILRTETAGPACIAMVQSILGDLT